MKIELFLNCSDVPVKYPQMRQRVQPTAGSTPSQTSQTRSYNPTGQPAGFVKRTVAAPSSPSSALNKPKDVLAPMSQSESSGSKIAKVFKLVLSGVLVFFILLGVLVFLNMEPTLNV